MKILILLDLSTHRLTSIHCGKDKDEETDTSSNSWSCGCISRESNEQVSVSVPDGTSVKVSSTQSDIEKNSVFNEDILATPGILII